MQSTPAALAPSFGDGDRSIGRIVSVTGAKAIVLLKCADRGISAQDLDSAMHSFANLQAATARRVLDFYHSRMKTRGAKASTWS